jgi:hypothetical protein
VLSKRPEERHATCSAFVKDLLDTVVDLAKDDRREVLGLLGLSGEGPLPEIVSTSFDETLVVARPESRKPLWPWAAALLLLVGLGAGWVFLKGPKGTRLQINSLPKGAKVFVNELAVGDTPTNQPLVPGDKLRLELKGHQPITYEFKPGEAPPTFPLQPIITEELLASSPEGATVVLDEKLLEGATPLQVRWNQGQPHRLTLTKGKLAFSRDFLIAETPQGKVFDLQEASTAETRQEPSLDPGAPGSLKLAGGFSVRVSLDGKDQGEHAPGSKLSVPKGSHKVELSNPTYFYRESRTVVVNAGQAVGLTVPGLATLTVDTFPGTGKVYVDDLDAHIESDGSSVQVALGYHKVTVRGSTGPKSESIELTGDRKVRFAL